jgi:hypothetical protein
MPDSQRLSPKTSLLSNWPVVRWLRERRAASRIRIHLYALCWNEARMLPYFFRHYDSVVDRYFIFDNGSTDGSRELLSKHPKVTLDEFRVDSASFVLTALEFYDQVWKQSRGQADWVIICNVDEHLYHRNLRRYLASLPREVTLIVAEGYEMISDTFPTGKFRLCDRHRTGVPDTQNDKPEILAPDFIQEINFIPGRHEAAPKGLVVTPLKREVKLLHYKCLGPEYLVGRYNELGARLREKDLAEKWGYQYSWPDSEKRDYFQRVKKRAIQVL